MASNFAEAMQQGYAFGAQQRDDRERRSKLAELAGLSSKVIGGDYEATNRAYAIDPQAAKTYQGEGERRREQLAGMARGWKNVPSEQRQAYYERFIAPAVSAMGFGDLGPYDETAVDGVATQILAAYGGGTPGGAVQSTFVDAQGNRVAIMRDGSTSVLGQNVPNNQIIDTGNGFFGVNKGNLSASPVMVGGQPQQAPQPSLQSGLYQTPAGMVRIGDGLTPEQQQAALADIQAGGTADNVQLPARNVAPQQFGGGQQLRSAPKPRAPSELDRRIEAARAMGASEDEIRRMIIGRDGAAAGAKPLPPAALKELLGVEDAMAAAQNVSSMIKKHSQRMADGSLVVGPVDSIGAQFRTRLGMSNANDVNLNEYRADLTKIVNESLLLNSGVQTEGDAQRAANELMDANDPATAARSLRRLQEYNTRAIELQKRKMDLVRRNYGQDASGQPTQQRPSSGASGAVLRYNPATGDFE